MEKKVDLKKKVQHNKLKILVLFGPILLFIGAYFVYEYYANYKIEEAFGIVMDEGLELTGMEEYVNGELTMEDKNKAGNIDPTYYFNYKGDINDSFNDLTDEEKYDLLNTFGEIFEQDLTCYNSNCRLSNLILYTSTDWYEVDLQYDLAVRENNVDIVYDIEEVDNSTIETSTTDTVDRQTVYQYMKNQYDQLTDYGNTYVPEVHDPLVAEMAAAKFNLSASEAEQIYIDFEMGYN